MKKIYLSRDHFSPAQKFVEVRINSQLTEVLIGDMVEVEDNVALVLQDAYPFVTIYAEAVDGVTNPMAREEAKNHKGSKKTKKSKAKKKN